MKRKRHMDNGRPGSMERMVGRHVIHLIREKLAHDTATVANRDVILMAVCKNYSMVRRPGCFPYVCDTRDLVVPVR